MNIKKYITTIRMNAVLSGYENKQCFDSARYSHSTPIKSYISRGSSHTLRPT